MTTQMNSFKLNSDNPGWVIGWGVLQKFPHDVISMHLTKEEAEAKAKTLGDNFEIKYGSRRLGSNDFIQEMVAS